MHPPSESRQIRQEKDKDVAVESEESTQGKAIDVDEDRLPSPAAALHEEIRQEGQKELERDAMALLWSAIAAGISMGTSFMAVGMLHNHLVFIGHIPWHDFIWPFALPTLAGNIIGGTFIFALISHAQIRNDMSRSSHGKRQKAHENEEKEHQQKR